MGCPVVVHITPSLGWGGDAKNVVSLAKIQREWASVSVLTTEAAGPRAPALVSAGVEVRTGARTSAALEQLTGPDSVPCVVIMHRNGASNSDETRLLTRLWAAGHAAFEFNTFGRPDPATDQFWAGHLHLSRSSQLQYARRRGTDPLGMSGHAPIGYPVLPAEPVSDAHRQDARRRLGVALPSFVVVRLVRPDLRKWDPLLVLGVAAARRRGIPVHLIVRAAPSERTRWVRRQLGQAATLLDPTVDEDEIRETLAAADVVANFSAIGETFGLALAEGMAMGLPALVNSTPLFDNAQVEWCLHGESGFVANTPGAIAGALRLLSSNVDYARQLGQQGRAHMLRMFAPEVIDGRIRAFIARRLSDLSHPLAREWPSCATDTGYSLDATWLCEHEHRARSGWTADGVRELPARIVLSLERLRDASHYARRLGVAGTARVLGRRIRSGTLARG